MRRSLKNIFLTIVAACLASNFGCSAGVDLAFKAMDAKIQFDKEGTTSTPMDVVWEATQLATKQLGIIEDNKIVKDDQIEFGGHIGKLDYIRVYLYKLTPDTTKIGVQARTALIPATQNGYDREYAMKIIDTINSNMASVGKKELPGDQGYRFEEEIKLSQGNNTKIDVAMYFPGKEGLQRRFVAKLKQNQKEFSYEGSEKNLGQRLLSGKKTIPVQFDVTNLTNGKKNSGLNFFTSDEAGYYAFAEQKSDMIEPKIIEPVNYIIRTPFTLGLQWRDEVKTDYMAREISLPEIVTIEKNDDVVTVPAGTFENCLRIKRVSSVVNEKGHKIKREAYFWYAPAIGEIKRIHKEQATDPSLNLNQGAVLTIELVSYVK